MILFPFNCWWRLGSNILNNSIYTTYTIAYLSCNNIKEIVFKIVPVSSHPILTCDSSQCNNMRMCSLITLNSNRPYGQENSKSLLYFKKKQPNQIKPTFTNDSKKNPLRFCQETNCKTNDTGKETSNFIKLNKKAIENNRKRKWSLKVIFLEGFKCNQIGT